MKSVLRVFRLYSQFDNFQWSDFNFIAPYHFQYGAYPNDRQRICFKFDDKRYFTVRFNVAPEVRNRRRESIADTHISGWTIEDIELTVRPSARSRLQHVAAYIFRTASM